MVFVLASCLSVTALNHIFFVAQASFLKPILANCTLITSSVAIRSTAGLPITFASKFQQFAQILPADKSRVALVSDIRILGNRQAGL